MKYIHQQENWPTFTYDQQTLAMLLGSIHHRQGRLLGHMESLGFNLREEAMFRTLTIDVIKNSEIENEILDLDQVRSSIARRLGLNIAGLVPSDRHIEGTVEMMLDATQHYDKPLTKERLFSWHAALFPTGRSGMHKIVVGDWRDDKQGAMQVISGPIGKERMHYEAPVANKIEAEMTEFLNWFNHDDTTDPILKSGIAHFWFVTLHPFEDGNGRIARTIADMQLARSENSSQRFYSVSAQIRKERNAYYKILEQSQKDSLNITAWLQWYLDCLGHALTTTESTLSDIIRKGSFWEAHIETSFNERQRMMLNKLLDKFEGNLTSTKWAKIAKCSQDTALRDIQDLIDRNILRKQSAGGRSTHYALPENKDV